VEVTLQTGRTHPIRVHEQHADLMSAAPCAACTSTTRSPSCRRSNDRTRNSLTEGLPEGHPARTVQLAADPAYRAQRNIMRVAP